MEELYAGLFRAMNRFGTVSYTHLDVYKRQGYGCLIILAGLLPQWIFYTAALLFYANSKKRQSRIVGWNSWQDRTRQLAEAGLVTGCVLLGTFVESFVNPAVFAWVLKIFC